MFSFLPQETADAVTSDLSKVRSQGDENDAGGGGRGGRAVTCGRLARFFFRGAGGRANSFFL